MNPLAHPDSHISWHVSASRMRVCPAAEFHEPRQFCISKENSLAPGLFLEWQNALLCYIRKMGSWEGQMHMEKMNSIKMNCKEPDHQNAGEQLHWNPSFLWLSSGALCLLPVLRRLSSTTPLCCGAAEAPCILELTGSQCELAKHFLGARPAQFVPWLCLLDVWSRWAA